MKKLSALLVIAALACGKRGDPKPPVPVIPQATSDLVVTQRGPKIVLAWSYPSLTTSGKSLSGLRRVVVYRYVEELPAQQPARDPNNLLPGDVDPTAPQPAALFARVPSLAPTQFNRLKQKLDSIEEANLPAATSGARLTYEDTPPFHATDGRPVRLTYSVVTEGVGARSDLSNLVTIVPIDVPVAPAALAAKAQAEGIVLTWSAPEKSVTGAAKPRVIGYNVYRLPEGQPEDDLAAPINAAPIAAKSFTDVPAYGAFQYRVSAVATSDAPRIESDLSAPVTATYKDLLPPPAPTGVTALVETKAVRLVWDPVESADLAGYRVYRTEAQFPPLLLTPGPVKETNFRDISPDLGISYNYSISAVDKSGNESARVATGWVLVPKTP